MPSPLPNPIDLLPVADRTPLTLRERREARAVQAVCGVLIVAVHAEGFTGTARVVPDSYDARWAWIRQRLAPLARWSRLARDVCDLMDIEQASTRWLDPWFMRRHIRRMDRRIARLAEVLCAEGRVPLRQRGTPEPAEDLFAADLPIQPPRPPRRVRHARRSR